MDTTRHDGKLAIVTGAGNGIGRATVVRLLKEGATVIGCDMNAAALDETRTLLAEMDLEADLVQADITNQADVDAVVARTATVDILANVAGIMDHFLPLGEIDDATWDRVIGVNLTGAMRLTRAVLPIMERAGSGAVVTVASEASLGAGASGVAYAASKHGVIGLVRHVAFFYGPKGIRSNAVLPGPVATNIAETAMPQSQWAIERAATKMATMPATPAEPDQIAAVISWLACAEASNVNGAIVASDGGWSSA
jgi:NAD(P)-dependent dehydrogenase (short-subunit alcohol dehydrogenase family)